MKFNIMKKVFSLLVLSFSLPFSAQKTQSLRLKKYRVAYLAEKLSETSGLAFLKGKLYAFNDSGNSNEYYEINPKNGEIIETHTVNFPNRDWEAMTSDGEYLYIADIGNNSGNRKDLVIYKIDGNSFTKIPFIYQNQSDFSPQRRSTNFDAEAVIFQNGKIQLFTKEWTSKKTTRYEIDSSIHVSQSINKKEEFSINFLVTDAYYYENQLYLIGYDKKSAIYLVIFNENDRGNFFNGDYHKYKLGCVFKYGQIEGIAVDEKGIYVSGESFNKLGFKIKQSLYFIPFKELKK